jgi:hypothetical protein
VLLPNGNVLLIGGRTNSPYQSPEQSTLVPLLFEDGSWRPMAHAATPRTYHGTALLLPDGRVLSAGADSATWDYQVFVPPCLHGGAPRPVVTSSPRSMAYFLADPITQVVTFDPLPAGEKVTEVVLIAPGSVTHHFDQSQRFIRLTVTGQTPTSISFQAPDSPDWAPAGFYMLFLVTERGVPSVARWVTVG